MKSKSGMPGGVVDLYGIGVEAYEPRMGGREGEVVAAEYGFEHAVAGTQIVVVAYHYDIGHAQPVEYVALHLKFVPQSEIGNVAAMNHEVDVAARVDALNRIDRLVEASLRVAQKCENDRLAILETILYQIDVLCVYARLAAHVGGVGMILECRARHHTYGC